MIKFKLKNKKEFFILLTLLEKRNIKWRSGHDALYFFEEYSTHIEKHDFVIEHYREKYILYWSVPIGTAYSFSEGLNHIKNIKNE